MHALPILLAALSAAPATSQEARALLAQGAYDELYLRFSAVKPDDLAQGERSLVAKALLEAAQKVPKDPVLAASLAEKSASLEPSAAAFLAAGEANLALNQPAAAALALENAIRLAPGLAPALLSRADLALKEGDAVLAEQLYARIKPGAPERTRAEAGLKAAKARREEKAKGLVELQKLESTLASGAKEAAPKGQEVTPAEVCRLTAQALCGVMRRCMPKAPQAAECTTAMQSTCTQLAAQRPIAGPLASRGEIQRCLEALARLSCEEFAQGPAMFESVPACTALKQSGTTPGSDE